MADTYVAQGLVATDTFAASSNITPRSDTERGQNAVFSCVVTIPVSPTDGCLFKAGGSFVGAWVGIRDSGTIFRVRAGEGSSATGSTVDAAVLNVPIANIPTDGEAHTIQWEFQITPGRVQLWIDGDWKGTSNTTASGPLKFNLWAGTASQSYIDAPASAPPAGEPNTAWPGTEVSSLTFYADALAISQDFIGWGSGPWSRSGWGRDAYQLLVNGASATASVSSEAPVIAAEANTTLTGVTATWAVGDLTVSAKASAVLSGVVGTGAAGDVGVIGAAHVTAAGVSGASILAPVNVSAAASATASGVDSTSALGDIAVAAGASVSPLGVFGSGATGDLGATGLANVTLTGTSATAVLGDFSVRLVNRVSVTGFLVTSSIGSVQVTAAAGVRPTGVVAVGTLGLPTVWGNVVAGDDGVWAEVIIAPDVTWTPVSPGTGVWTDIST